MTMNFSPGPGKPFGPQRFGARPDGPARKPAGRLPSAEALPLPPELPEGLACRPRVLQLIDADAVSHGLVDGTVLGRASDEELRLCLDVVQATATALDPQARARYAASSKTAAHHLDVLTASGNGTWSIRRGLNGADQVILEELNSLIEARLLATRPNRSRPTRLADLVLLVAADHAYAPAVRQLRLLGVPTWLMVPGRFAAASLYSCCCAVSFLAPQLSPAPPAVFPPREEGT
jgi:hypothetical protein